jgi:hypothetical protein
MSPVSADLVVRQAHHEVLKGPRVLSYRETGSAKVDLMVSLSNHEIVA